MTQFEYRLWEPHADHVENRNDLHVLGRDGWEAVCSTAAGVLFKRQRGSGLRTLSPIGRRSA